MLDHADVAPYLLSRGLALPSDVVDGTLSISDGSRRNRVYLVSTGADDVHVLKQDATGQAAALAHEAGVLRALARVASLRDRIPAVVEYDGPSALLVLRTPGGGRDWGAHHALAGFPVTQARALGTLLADVHALPADTVAEAPRGHAPMWGLSLLEPPIELVDELSAGGREVVARIQENRSLASRIASLGDGLSAERLIHGDVRWENCVAVAARPGLRRTRVLLIDWELAGRGVPAFDVGSVLAEYLRVWVGSVPIASPSPPGQAGYPLARMQPAVGAFWSAYREAGARVPLREVIELTALRLLQAAVERSQGLAVPSRPVMTLVQLAANLLSQPEAAALQLLGLRE